MPFLGHICKLLTLRERDKERNGVLREMRRELFLGNKTFLGRHLGSRSIYIFFFLQKLKLGLLKQVEPPKWSRRCASDLEPIGLDFIKWPFMIVEIFSSLLISPRE